MPGPEVLMADGALKRQGDSLTPQGVVCRVRQTADNAAAATYNAPVPFGAKEFDPYNWFDSAGGTYRFQPKIAGYYRCTTLVSVSGAGSGAEVDLYLRKNATGTSANGVFAATIVPTLASGWAGPEVSGIVYLNGTTDYVDVLLWVANACLMRGTAQQYPFFEAELIGVSAGVIPEPWHNVGAVGEPAFGAGWSNNYTDGTNYARFYKDPYGIVRLNGSLKSTGAGAVAFTLPVGYRPSYGVGVALSFWTGSTRGLGIISIGNDGGVRCYGGADQIMAMSYVNIDSQFRAEL